MSSSPSNLAQRRAASSAYLGRRLAGIAWHGVPSPRTWLVETCRAELEWAVAEWRCLADDPEPVGPGPHPSEDWRLPHERAAARVVNCHLHLDVALSRWRELVPRLRCQRAAALDDRLPVENRLYWANAATGTARDIRTYLARRRLAWHCFLVAAADYNRLKALLEQENLRCAA